MTNLLFPPGPLASTEWLADNLSHPKLRVVDIRGKVLPAGTVGPRYQSKRDAYVEGHIPGSVFIDWTADIIDPGDPVHMQIALPESFARLMESLGIADDTAVIAYDDYDAIFAGRLAWALRYYGHDAVRILDGGYPLWLREGRAVSTEAPSYAAQGARFTARARPELRRTADAVELARKTALLIDARSEDQFRGKVSAAARKGHIPGATNVPYTKLIDPQTGKFLERDRLREVFASQGVDVAKLPGEVIVYCNGGVSATVPLTALALLGRDDVAVYDGSWNEWGNDPNRPLET